MKIYIIGPPGSGKQHYQKYWKTSIIQKPMN